MDPLWDDNFDEAWKRVHRQDYETEIKLTNELDKFFQQYHLVFLALVKQPDQSPDEFSDVCDRAFSQAQALAYNAWRAVGELHIRKLTTMSGGTPAREALKRQALELDRQAATIVGDDGRQRLQLARSAVEVSEKFLSGA